MELETELQSKLSGGNYDLPHKASFAQTES